jgi:hypothetical protein
MEDDLVAWLEVVSLACLSRINVGPEAGRLRPPNARTSSSVIFEIHTSGETVTTASDMSISTHPGRWHLVDGLHGPAVFDLLGLSR